MTDPSFQLRAGETGAVVTGTPGNVLTFQADGAVRGEPPSGGGGVESWNTRTGAVVPASGDYAASEVTNDAANVPGATVAAALNGTPALADWICYPATDFPAGVVTQVDCEPATTAPNGTPLAGAVGGWNGNSPADGLVVVGCQLDGLGTNMRVFVLNTTGADILGIGNALFTCTYPRAAS